MLIWKVFWLANCPVINCSFPVVYDSSLSFVQHDARVLEGFKYHSWLLHGDKTKVNGTAV